MSEDLDSNKIVAELLKLKLEDVTKPFLEKLKKWWLKKEFGVSITPEEADEIKKISNSPLYIDFKNCLGDHWSKDLIKVGLFISRLNEQKRVDRARLLADEAYKTKGQKGRKIIHLASTGILIPVLDYIKDIKYRKGANYIIINQEFDKILEEWDKISLPINREMEKEDIKEKIKSIIQSNFPIFFIY